MTNTCIKCGKVFTHNEPVYVAYGCDVDSHSDKFTRGGIGGRAHPQMLVIMCRRCYELSMQEENKNAK